MTAHTGFRAAVVASARETRGTVIHSGFWGCGAFGGNKVMMLMLQQIAAKMVGVDRLVLHVMNGVGREPAKGAGVRVKELVGERDIGV